MEVGPPAERPAVLPTAPVRRAGRRPGAPAGRPWPKCSSSPTRSSASICPRSQQDIEKFRQAAPRRKAWLEQLFARIEELRANALRAACRWGSIRWKPPLAAPWRRTCRPRSNRTRRKPRVVRTTCCTAISRAMSQSLACRARLVEELRQNRALTPEQLFEKLVHGVFNPHYECGKTRVADDRRGRRTSPAS